MVKIKKMITYFLCLLFLLIPMNTFAAENSTPKLLVTSYEIENGYVSPENSTTVKITVSNVNKQAAAKNIVLRISDDNGEIRTDGMGNTYIEKIKAGDTYIWEQTLTATYNATVGEHKLYIEIEYGDANGGFYSENQTLYVDVRQSVNLDYSGATLPVKVTQNSTQTVAINLMNTGKSTLYNCKIDFDIEGLSSGGSTFAGEISPGESKSASTNLRVSNEILGEVKGTITISYEDAFGETYTKTAKLSTVIEKEVEVTQEPQENEETKNPLWWLFILIGLIIGGGIGFGIPWYINDKKQRKEDDLRL